ncbi:MAG: B12-binding domain-containing radical SAM protein [Betaproteobacteria bacterium RIFCSPLOWO2_02_FULL_66_14]|nr:MAG: B12-binding domain-containing radical SAM protein [Betaproteobacteria bacterium RIFCSPLOWO2_02_FULL_66_14]
MKILLVYPRTPATFWSFQHVLPFVAKRAAFPPLGLLTVAAMLPRDWELLLVDQNVSALSDAQIRWADAVFLSGMVVHGEAAHEVARRCSELGRPVVAGGPLFTTGHADFPEVPHFVCGEAEGVIGELVSDLANGTLKSLYRSHDWPDVRRTPVPRWDLVRVRDYVTMPVQFSRGCPFECEFCDIVVMNGRVPRTKDPEQVVRELDALRAAGWRDRVFLVDDNFIGNRKRARELLRELIRWRERTASGMGFFTEASVNLADDAELLELMVRAGFRKVFLGLETPSLAGLEECGKTQNRRRDLKEVTRTLQNAGLEVMGGFIVGFDSDGEDIFQRQFEFIQRSGVVTAMVGLLNALPQTALYARLAREGRLLAESCGNNTAAAINFVTRLDREILIQGYRELMRKLYEPGPYYRRIRTFLAAYRPRGPRLRLSWSDVRAFAASFWLLGVWQRGRFGYWRLLATTLVASPRKFGIAVELAILGHHFRRVARAL